MEMAIRRAIRTAFWSSVPRHSGWAAGGEPSTPPLRAKTRRMQARVTSCLRRASRH
jgi:hypothetical protein